MSLFFDETAGESARPDRRGRRIALSVLAAAIVALALTLLVGVGYVASLGRSVSHNLARSAGMPPEVPVATGGAARPAKAPDAAQAVNYVIMGSDSRSTDARQGRSDVLMVLHLAGDRKSASLVSFPRDLYVPIPGHGRNKINAAFAFGGTALTVRTLEQLLQTRMDHVALVDFAGFVTLTEQLDGVTVDNPHPSVSQGYTFPTGRITISGEEALAYVRERKQLPRRDLDRAERQRLVAQAVLAKGMSKKVLLNPVAFHRFASGLAQQLTVDDQLTVGELRSTALSIRFRPGDVASLQAPVSGVGTSPSGQSIVRVDQHGMAELAQALREDRMADYVDQHPRG